MSLRKEIYQAFVECAEGYTTKEILDIFRPQGFGYTSITARTSDLKKSGLIGDSGRKRKTASGAKVAVLVTEDRIPAHVRRKSDWCRATVAGMQRHVHQFELFQSGGRWYLKLPGEPNKPCNSFDDAIEKLGRLVERRDRAAAKKELIKKFDLPENSG